LLHTLLLLHPTTCRCGMTTARAAPVVVCLAVPDHATAPMPDIRIASAALIGCATDQIGSCGCGLRRLNETRHSLGLASQCSLLSVPPRRVSHRPVEGRAQHSADRRSDKGCAVHQAFGHCYRIILMLEYQHRRHLQGDVRII
jgi:hypothetical protein